MTSKTLLSLCCFVTVGVLFSCSKDQHSEPYLKKGDITGKVIIYDSLGRALSNHSGVVVTIDSTNLSAITDSTGAYTFKKVKTGRYSFTYKKNGYGTYRIIRQLHAGGPPTLLPVADVGKIYNGPPVSLFDYFGLGSPDNPQVVTYTEFQSPMRLPTASVLYIDTTPALTSTNFRAYIRYNAQQGFQNSMWYQTPDIDPHVIRADSILINARRLYFYLAFDNVRDIKYVDEQGRTIHPCTGTKLGSFMLSGSTFQENPNSSRQASDGIQLRFRHQ
ncbi:carboxypeptidase-like regulatory domain-containing protein [Chitinophaga ginsengisoli]|uniref:Carboxypeptidase family protein n=1 Tax=Chitinophaga ginsengisoli TaxID=363837 RepID=A0A2P8GHP5_9BACT|nr:carboxypeptidase-like regulatory domain-containing protein [Chitinophaga ginsengisoli]PSL33493.1 carboxypeptidase family protein [Chitinophaga ginsengisoli]